MLDRIFENGRSNYWIVEPAQNADIKTLLQIAQSSCEGLEEVTIHS